MSNATKDSALREITPNGIPTTTSASSLLDVLGIDHARWASLQANQRSTRYRCTGRGPVAIVLLRSVRTRGVWAALLGELANAHRVLIPEFDWPAGELATWLRGFVDGVGARQVILVAGEDLTLAAAELRLEDPDRVSHAVLVPEHWPPTGSLASLLARAQKRDAQGPLVLSESMDELDAVLALRAYLGAPSAPTLPGSP